MDDKMNKKQQKQQLFRLKPVTLEWAERKVGIKAHLLEGKTPRGVFVPPGDVSILVVYQNTPGSVQTDVFVETCKMEDGTTKVVTY